MDQASVLARFSSVWQDNLQATTFDPRFATVLEALRNAIGLQARH